MISYSVSIVPIMTTYCTTKGCHNPTGSGTGDYTTYAGLAAKADAPLGNGSLRKRAIDGDPTWMPSPNGLPDSLKQKIDCWLQQGAKNN